MKLLSVFSIASALAKKCTYISARIETELSEVGVIKNQNLIFYAGKALAPINNGSIDVDGTKVTVHAIPKKTSVVAKDNPAGVPKYDLELSYKSGSNTKKNIIEYGYSYTDKKRYDIYRDKELCF